MFLGVPSACASAGRDSGLGLGSWLGPNKSFLCFQRSEEDGQPYENETTRWRADAIRRRLMPDDDVDSLLRSRDVRVDVETARNIIDLFADPNSPVARTLAARRHQLADSTHYFLKPDKLMVSSWHNIQKCLLILLVWWCKITNEEAVVFRRNLLCSLATLNKKMSSNIKPYFVISALNLLWILPF